MAIPSEGPVEAKGTPREKEAQAPRRESPRAGGPEDTEQLIFTLRPATGEVVRIEKVDTAGKRAEVAKEETIALADKRNLEEIDAALDEAFEAGIFSMLDPGGDGEAAGEGGESAEELELRGVLLKLIIGREVRQRLQRRMRQRLVLSRTLSH